MSSTRVESMFQCSEIRLTSSLSGNRVDVAAHQRPRVAARRRRGNDRTLRASLAQPRPQEVAAVPAAAMQRDDEWPRRRRVVVLRHVQRHTTTLLARVLAVHHTDVFARRVAAGDALEQRGIVAARGIDEEPADGRERSCKRIERLDRERRLSHRPVRFQNAVGIADACAQSAQRPFRRAARLEHPILERRKRLGPRHRVERGNAGRKRLSDPIERLNHVGQVRRMQVARRMGERFERHEQRRHERRGRIEQRIGRIVPSRPLPWRAPSSVHRTIAGIGWRIHRPRGCHEGHPRPTRRMW